MPERRVPIGTRRLTPLGYIRIYTEEGRDLEHRVVWKQHHGEIPKGANIHHINGDKTDNHIENLQMFSSYSEHMKQHPQPFGRKRSVETRAKMSESAKRNGTQEWRKEQLREAGYKGAAKRWDHD